MTAAEARPVMTAEEWRAKALASRPPLSQQQISVLRAIFRPAVRTPPRPRK